MSTLNSLSALSVLLAMLVTSACSGSGGSSTEPEPAVGAIRVVTGTTGPDPDPDGYEIALSGAASAIKKVSANDTIIFKDIPKGAANVAISGVVVNCVADTQSASVNVVGGDTTTVTFAVACDAAGTIAFQSDRDGDWNIYLVAGNGQDVRGLPTSDSDQDTYPVWSPDGAMLAYHSGPTGQILTIARAEPKDFVRQLTSPQDVGVEGRPGWSPDGHRLVFFGSQQLNLYTINADGTGLTKVAGNTFSVLEAKWSPTGERLAFTARIEPAPQSAWTVRTDGSDLTKLIYNNFNSFMPDWSPDGTRVVFVSQHTGLFVADFDGANQVQITNDGDAINPRWSPTGDRIVFETGGNLFIVNANGTGRFQLTTGAAKNSDPEWSPDGSRIVFVSNRTGNSDLFAVRADGRNLTQLTRSSGNDARPVWRP